MLNDAVCRRDQCSMINDGELRLSSCFSLAFRLCFWLILGPFHKGVLDGGRITSRPSTEVTWESIVIRWDALWSVGIRRNPWESVVIHCDPLECIGIRWNPLTSAGIRLHPLESVDLRWKLHVFTARHLFFSGSRSSKHVILFSLYCWFFYFGIVWLVMNTCAAILLTVICGYVHGFSRT